MMKNTFAFVLVCGLAWFSLAASADPVPKAPVLCLQGKPCEQPAAAPQPIPAPPPASSPTPAGSAIKWQPGWYAEYNSVCRLSDGTKGCTLAAIRATIASEVCAQPNIVGLKLFTTPSFVMDDTYGSYAGGTKPDRGFAAFDQILKDLNACGKKLMLNVLYGWGGGMGSVFYYYPKFTFGASCTSGADCTGGTDMADKYGFDAADQYNPPSGGVARLWLASWRDLAIAATKAYCARYDSNPAFYSLGMLYWNSGLPFKPGHYDANSFAKNYAAWAMAARAACPTTNIDVLVDYTASNDWGWSFFQDAIIPARGVLTNNDIRPDGPTAGQMVYIGEQGYPPTMYRGKIRYAEEIETPDQCGKFGNNPPEWFADRMQNGNAGHTPTLPSQIIVAMSTQCPAGYDWEAWKAYINSIGGKVWNGRDTKLRTTVDVKSNWCEDGMVCK